MEKKNLMPSVEELQQIRYYEEPSATAVIEICVEWIRKKGRSSGCRRYFL